MPNYNSLNNPNPALKDMTQYNPLNNPTPALKDMTQYNPLNNSNPALKDMTQYNPLNNSNPVLKDMTQYNPLNHPNPALKDMTQYNSLNNLNPNLKDMTQYNPLNNPNPALKDMTQCHKANSRCIPSLFWGGMLQNNICNHTQLLLGSCHTPRPSYEALFSLQNGMYTIHHLNQQYTVFIVEHVTNLANHPYSVCSNKCTTYQHTYTNCFKEHATNQPTQPCISFCEGHTTNQSR